MENKPRLQKLIIKAKNGDEEATAELVSRLAPLVKKYTRRLSYDDAYCELVTWIIEAVHRYQPDTGLSSINLPVFIAISPIQGNTPQVTGGNIKGYIAYYVSCPADADVSTVAGWGAMFNTVQFSDSNVNCAP